MVHRLDVFTRIRAARTLICFAGWDTSEKVLIRGTLSARTVNSIQLDLDPKAESNVL